MAFCNEIEVIAAGDLLLTWEPVGDIEGFADGSDAFSFKPSDDTRVTLNMASDGRSGSISGSDSTHGMVTVKVKPGALIYDRLTEIWYADKFTQGIMTATNIRTDNGRTFTFSCAGLSMIPGSDQGSESPDSFDFEFWVSGVTFTGKRSLQTTAANV